MTNEIDKVLNQATLITYFNYLTADTDYHGKPWLKTAITSHCAHNFPRIPRAVIDQFVNKQFEVIK